MGTGREPLWPVEVEGSVQAGDWMSSVLTKGAEEGLWPSG